MDALPRSVWHEPSPPDPPVRVWHDWVLVGVALAVVVLEGLLRPDVPQRWLQVAVLVALVPLLLWRRARPLLVLVAWVATTALLALVTGDADGLYSAAFALLLPYAVVRWGSGRQAVTGLAILLVSAVAAVVAGTTSPGEAVGGFAVLFAALTLGGAARYRASARARELDQVALRERERLARDLHDTVAHHVSAIAIRAQAGLATAAIRPDAADDALRLIEAEASSTLAEMRSMVRVLRGDESADLAPTPGIADLHRIAAEDADGPAVAVEVTGDVDAVAPSVAAAVYRLAQESVTNARRHARRATRIDVRVAVDDVVVHLRVSDDGDPGPGRPGEPGFGLRGMAERASLLGGTFAAGPAPGRGWTVAADLPRRGPA